MKKKNVLILLVIIAIASVASAISYSLWFPEPNQSIEADVTAYGKNPDYRNLDRREGWESLMIDVTVGCRVNGC